MVHMDLTITGEPYQAWRVALLAPNVRLLTETLSKCAREGERGRHSQDKEVTRFHSSMSIKVSREFLEMREKCLGGKNYLALFQIVWFCILVIHTGIRVLPLCFIFLSSIKMYKNVANHLLATMQETDV